MGAGEGTFGIKNVMVGKPKLLKNHILGDKESSSW